MKGKIRKAVSVIMAAILMISAMPMSFVATAQAAKLPGGTIYKSFDYSEGEYNFGDGTFYNSNNLEYNGYMTEYDGVTLQGIPYTEEEESYFEVEKPMIKVYSGEHYIKLKDVHMVSVSDVSPIDIQGGTVHLIVESGNTIVTRSSAAAIHVGKDARLIIEGTGTLYASSNGDGAGIGANGHFMSTDPAGYIEINGGIITAEGNYGAGIGGGSETSVNDIVINGGTITARSTYGGGLGGGLSGTYARIAINGGSVDCTGEFGPGIGRGKGCTLGTEYINITGGTVSATSSQGNAIGNGQSSYGNMVINVSGGDVTASAQWRQAFSNLDYSGYKNASIAYGASADSTSWTASTNDMSTVEAAKYVSIRTLCKEHTFINTVDPANNKQYHEYCTTCYYRADISSVDYIDRYFNPWMGKVCSIRETATDCTFLSPSTEDVTLTSGWYAVVNKVDFTNAKLIISGDVKIIILDDYGSLTTNKNITINEGSTLTIYGQEKSNGKLTVNNPLGGTTYDYAIGCSDAHYKSTSFILNGCDVSLSGAYNYGIECASVTNGGTITMSDMTMGSFTCYELENDLALMKDFVTIQTGYCYSYRNSSADAYTHEAVGERSTNHKNIQLKPCDAHGYSAWDAENGSRTCIYCDTIDYCTHDYEQIIEENNGNKVIYNKCKICGHIDDKHGLDCSEYYAAVSTVDTMINSDDYHIKYSNSNITEFEQSYNDIKESYKTADTAEKIAALTASLNAAVKKINDSVVDTAKSDITIYNSADKIEVTWNGKTNVYSHDETISIYSSAPSLHSITINGDGGHENTNIPEANICLVNCDLDGDTAISINSYAVNLSYDGECVISGNKGIETEGGYLNLMPYDKDATISFNCDSYAINCPTAERLAAVYINGGNVSFYSDNFYYPVNMDLLEMNNGAIVTSTVGAGGRGFFDVSNHSDYSGAIVNIGGYVVDKGEAKNLAGETVAYKTMSSNGNETVEAIDYGNTIYKIRWVEKTTTDSNMPETGGCYETTNADSPKYFDFMFNEKLLPYAYSVSLDVADGPITINNTIGLMNIVQGEQTYTSSSSDCVLITGSSDCTGNLITISGGNQIPDNYTNIIFYYTTINSHGVTGDEESPVVINDATVNLFNIGNSLITSDNISNPTIALKNNSQLRFYMYNDGSPLLIESKGEPNSYAISGEGGTKAGFVAFNSGVVNLIAAQDEVINTEAMDASADTKNTTVNICKYSDVFNHTGLINCNYFGIYDNNTEDEIGVIMNYGGRVYRQGTATDINGDEHSYKAVDTNNDASDATQADIIIYDNTQYNVSYHAMDGVPCGTPITKEYYIYTNGDETKYFDADFNEVSYESLVLDENAHDYQIENISYTETEKTVVITCSRCSDTYTVHLDITAYNAKFAQAYEIQNDETASEKYPREALDTFNDNITKSLDELEKAITSEQIDLATENLGGYIDELKSCQLDISKAPIQITIGDDEVVVACGDKTQHLSGRDFIPIIQSEESCENSINIIGNGNNSNIQLYLDGVNIEKFDSQNPDASPLRLINNVNVMACFNGTNKLSAGANENDIPGILIEEGCELIVDCNMATESSLTVIGSTKDNAGGCAVSGASNQMGGFLAAYKIDKLSLVSGGTAVNAVNLNSIVVERDIVECNFGSHGDANSTDGFVSQNHYFGDESKVKYGGVVIKDSMAKDLSGNNIHVRVVESETDLLICDNEIYSMQYIDAGASADYQSPATIEHYLCNKDGVVRFFGMDLNELANVVDSENNCTVEIKNANYEVVKTIYVSKMAQTALKDIKHLLIAPTPDESHIFVGWADENGKLIDDNTVINGDMVLVPAMQLYKIEPSDNSSFTVDRTTSIISSEPVFNGSTVKDYKNSFKNEASLIIIEDAQGNRLSDNDLVGTGCVIKSLSQLDGTIFLDSLTVVVMGDVNGDGLLDDNDYNLLKTNMFMCDFGGAYFAAADICKDGAIDGFDLYLMSLSKNSVNGKLKYSVTSKQTLTDITNYFGEGTTVYNADGKVVTDSTELLGTGTKIVYRRNGITVSQIIEVTEA